MIFKWFYDGYLEWKKSTDDCSVSLLSSKHISVVDLWIFFEKVNIYYKCFKLS